METGPAPLHGLITHCAEELRPANFHRIHNGEPEADAPQVFGCFFYRLGAPLAVLVSEGQLHGSPRRPAQFGIFEAILVNRRAVGRRKVFIPSLLIPSAQIVWAQQTQFPAPPSSHDHLTYRPAGSQGAREHTRLYRPKVHYVWVTNILS